MLAGLISNQSIGGTGARDFAGHEAHVLSRLNARRLQNKGRRWNADERRIKTQYLSALSAFIGGWYMIDLSPLAILQSTKVAATGRVRLIGAHLWPKPVFSKE